MVAPGHRPPQPAIYIRNPRRPLTPRPCLGENVTPGGMMHSVRLAVFSLFACATLRAQFDSGQIAGFVRDPSLAVVAGAGVTVTNEGNGEKHRVVTNSTGYYVVPNLFVGTYSVEV